MRHIHSKTFLLALYAHTFYNSIKLSKAMYDEGDGWMEKCREQRLQKAAAAAALDDDEKFNSPTSRNYLFFLSTPLWMTVKIHS